MKAQLKNNNGNKHQQDRKIIQLSDLIELNDQEAQLLFGGWITNSSQVDGTNNNYNNNNPTGWGGGGGGGGS